MKISGLVQNPYSRRGFLKGAGLTLTLPILETLGPRKAYASESTNRFVGVFAPCGVVHRDFWPTGTFGTADNWQLSKILSPLSIVKDQLNVYKGLNMKVADIPDQGTHARGPGCYLTSSLIRRDRVQAGISVDQVIAQAHKGQTPLASLQLGNSDVTYFCDEHPCIYSTSISWASTTQALGKIVNLNTAFNTIVAGVNTNQPVDTADTKLKKSILDAVSGDIARLQRNISYLDKLKMDEYLAGVRDIEQRINSANTGASCNTSAAPTDTTNREMHSATMVDLIHLALMCDQTRIVSFMLDTARSEYRYDFLGVSGAHHTISHHGGNVALLDQLSLINTWWYKQIANLAKKLAGTSDSLNSGTLLDNTVIYLSNSITDGDTHGFYDMPVITVGGKNTALKVGQYVDVRNAGQELPTANLFLTLLQSVYGLGVNSFGDSSGNLRQILK